MLPPLIEINFNLVWIRFQNRNPFALHLPHLNCHFFSPPWLSNLTVICQSTPPPTITWFSLEIMCGNRPFGPTSLRRPRVAHTLALSNTYSILQMIFFKSSNKILARNTNCWRNSASRAAPLEDMDRRRFGTEPFSEAVKEETGQSLTHGVWLADG